MHYYKYKEHYIISQKQYIDFQQTREQEIAASDEMLYYLVSLDAKSSRRSFAVSSPDLLYIEGEGLELLKHTDTDTSKLPAWMIEKINKGMIKAVNAEYPQWENAFENTLPKSWRINIAGLGDVGSTMLTGLKLLGQDKISQIGIFDIDNKKVARWEFESNQILFPNGEQSPRVFAAKEEELFDCDMFVFCVTVGIPDLTGRDIDVRMAQFEGNSRVISIYAKKAREYGFKGIFAVVSDPVDLLCKKALIESNTDLQGNYDFKGLAPEQIRGYGLGVMHARASYYAAQQSTTQHYLSEGRAFGPHGEHLVIADSINEYNNALSLELTEKARKANLELRSYGFKPYVAPALSSGAISILETVKGNWNYSATYMGGVYMGARNKLAEAGTILEQLPLPEELMKRLYISYKELERII